LGPKEVEPGRQFRPVARGGPKNPNGIEGNLKPPPPIPNGPVQKLAGIAKIWNQWRPPPKMDRLPRGLCDGG